MIVHTRFSMDFYKLLKSWLNTSDFPSDLHRLVWRLYRSLLKCLLVEKVKNNEREFKNSNFELENLHFI